MAMAGRKTSQLCFIVLCAGLWAGLSVTTVWAQKKTAISARNSGTRRATDPMEIVTLPKVKASGKLSIEQALQEQSAIYEMGATPLDYPAMGQISWAAQVRTNPLAMSQARDRRATVSPDPRQNMQLRWVTATGVYSYDPTEHQLQQESKIDSRLNLLNATVPSLAAGTFGNAIVITGPGRGPNARATEQLKRSLWLETGRIVQNINLQAASLKLTTNTVDTFEPQSLGQILGLPRNSEVLAVIFVGKRLRRLDPDGSTDPSQGSRTRRVVLVVPPTGYNDQELHENRRVLGLAGITPIVASTHAGAITSALNKSEVSQLALEGINLQQIDALIFIGGPGVPLLATQARVAYLAQQALLHGKLVGATGTAPQLLANANMLQGVKVAADPSIQPFLQQAGALVTGNPVERNGLILTARGPDAITAFARTVANALAGR